LILFTYPIWTLRHFFLGSGPQKVVEITKNIETPGKDMLKCSCNWVLFLLFRSIPLPLNHFFFFAGPVQLVQGPERVVHVQGPTRVVRELVEGPERIMYVPGPERVVHVEGPEKIVHVPVQGPERIVHVQGPERVVHVQGDNIQTCFLRPHVLTISENSCGTN